MTFLWKCPDEKVAATKSKVLESSQFQFKFKGNRIQHQFNEAQSDRVEKAIDKIKKGESGAALTKLEEVQKEFKQRNKYIKIADKPEYGWKVVEEYQSEALVDNEEDGKKLKQAVKVVAAKSKMAFKPNRESARKSGAPYDQRKRAPETYPNPYHSNNFSNFRPYSQARYNRFSAATGPRTTDICFSCGKHGHWRRNCTEWFSKSATNKASGSTQ